MWLVKREPAIKFVFVWRKVVSSLKAVDLSPQCPETGHAIRGWVRKLHFSGLIVSFQRDLPRTGCQSRTTAFIDLTVTAVAARRRNRGILRLVWQNDARRIP